MTVEVTCRRVAVHIWRSIAQYFQIRASAQIPPDGIMINRPYLEHDVVEHCTLRCDGCSHYSPYMDSEFSNIEEFKKDVVALSDTLHVEKFRLLGGEPLLHDDLHEFVKL